MRNLYIAVIIVLIAWGLTKPAHALRCGNRVISAGDSVLKVFEHCGQPLYQDFTMYLGKISKLYIYKQNGREQRVFLRNGNVVGVI